MPQLSKADAKATAEVEAKTFEAIPEGIYQGVLQEVEVREGPKGEYWSWKFGSLVNVETDETAPGSQWVNTSLSEDARWKLKETFEAFGADPSTDTDTLLGSEVWLAVSQRVIEKGPRMGETGNQVERVMPVGGGEG